ncbi:hypothetical protein [Bradyrhizobium sp. ISRA443]|uniref:hypothetical protein n=1 Tax=unclassified Bradyrhizobium TaxID=2631580 RepID=UPI0032AF0B17
MKKLKSMKAHWRADKPKLKACRKEVKAKGLTGDDPRFYIADCMEKTNRYFANALGSGGVTAAAACPLMLFGTLRI